MNRAEYFKFIESEQAKGMKIMHAKSADYAADSDPFQNFGLFEYVFRNIDLSKCDKTAVGLVLRKLDKIQRMANLLERENQVADEKIEDTILDDANYDYILLAYLHDKRGTV